ncbi:MAG: acylphosphatase [DPANN group archaeon]|nr:acylphosphatase [DPANN group archaeon]
MYQLNILVTGKVQRVSYRRFAKTWADNFKIMGWCRNLDTGQVEITVEGSKENIDNFVKKLKEGPPESKVDDIKITRLPLISGFSSFTIKYKHF